MKPLQGGKMTIFAKLCCVVGQIVVGALLGFLMSKIIFKLQDWIDDGTYALKTKWKMRKFEKALS